MVIRALELEDESTDLGSSKDAGTPLWWLARLERALNERKAEFDRYNDYYEGRHPLLFATPKFRSAFGRLFEEFADNWCEIVVDVPADRIRVEGFRIPSEEGSPDEADQAAWTIWQRNHLDAESDLAHIEGLIYGESSALVEPDDTGDLALITVEHPLQMIVASAAGARYKRAAALKRWEDDDGREMATLWLPEATYKFQARKRARSRSLRRWEPREAEDEPWPLPNPLEVVPVVPLYNQQRMLSAGRSELKQVIPLQDAANKILADMLVASEYAAYPQRWATGLVRDKDPDTGQTKQDFEAAVDRLWFTKTKDAKFGQFEAAELKNYVNAADAILERIAAKTRTPPQHFFLKGELPQRLSSTEAGLVAKVRRKTRAWGESWEEIERLALRIEGDERANSESIETIWGDPESRTGAEEADAILKRVRLGIPWAQAMEDLGYSPTQIERMREQLMDEDEPEIPANARVAGE